jgi:N-methylhydantoinase B
MDPITLEVIREGLISIVREMRANLIRSAFSSAICEIYDLSCAVLDAKGQLVAQSEDNPQHIFPLLWSTRLVLEKFGREIRPGDVFIHNDPYDGGTHLNDIGLIQPIFHRGRPILFAVVRAHWEDVGGATPGSISGLAKEILEEGIRIPPVKVIDRGRVNETFLELLFANMRIPEERRGDFRAMVGTCRVGERRLRELIRKYGWRVLDAHIRAMLDKEEHRVRAKLRAIPPGELRYEFYLDPRPDLPEPLVIRVRVAVEREQITVDFSGSSKQMPGPFNMGPAIAPTGVFMVLKSVLSPTSPVNSGSFRPMKVIVPEGTFLNARSPAAVGAMGDVRRCLESALVGALAGVIPEALQGDVKGASNQVLLSGTQPETGQVFLHYEAPAGGTGGFLEADGNNTLRTFLEGDFTTIQPTEAVETKFPLLVVYTKLREDSSGHGRRRGGLGVSRAIRFLAHEGRLSIVSEKNVVPPFGIAGGLPGAPNRFGVLRDGEPVSISAIPGKATGFPLRHGDVVVEQSSGGGGYGDPLEREPERVVADCHEGYITPEVATDVYGVVLSDGGWDEAATVARRKALATRRLYLAAYPSRGSGHHPPGYREVLLAPETARRAGISAGELVECVRPDGSRAPLRGWMRLLDTVGIEQLQLGADAFGYLGIRAGDRVEIRRLTAA